MVKNEYILVFDIGTTSVKSILINANSGELVASATRRHSTTYIDQYRVEQDPLEWWQGVIYTTRDILSTSNVNSNQIIGIGVTGQTPNCLPVDERGLRLRNAIIHMDTRSFPIVERLKKKISEKELIKETGARLDPRVDFARILWLKDSEPNIYKATYKFLQAKDYIVLKLTDEFITDYTDASLGFGLLSIKDKAYSKRLLNLLEIDKEKLPEPKPSTHIAGELTKKAADDLRLIPGIPVITGACDAAAAVLGSGALKPGSTLMYLGGSIFVIATSNTNILDLHRIVLIDHNLLGYPIDLQTGGICYDWVKDKILRVERDRCATERRIEVYKALDEEAEKVEPGSQGLIFLPYLAGGPSIAFNPNIRGLFYGLSLLHTRGHLLRAVMEGIAFEFRLMIEHLELAGLEIKEIYLTGGGTNSTLWCDIISNVLGRMISIPATIGYEAAYGVALAVIASLNKRNLSEVQRLTKAKCSYMPNPLKATKYLNIYSVYKKIAKELLLKTVEGLI